MARGPGARRSRRRHRSLWRREPGAVRHVQPGTVERSGYSIGFWFRMDATESGTIFLHVPWSSGCSGASDTLTIRCNETNGDVEWWHRASTSTRLILATALRGVNSWHFVAMTWDGTTVRAWLDGVEEDSGSATTVCQTQTDWYFGRGSTVSSEDRDAHWTSSSSNRACEAPGGPAGAPPIMWRPTTAPTAP